MLKNLRKLNEFCHFLKINVVRNKVNYIALGAGILMILISFLNYLMNKDHVSLGIFVFLGGGFILISIKGRYEKNKSERINKYALTFFFVSFVIFLYWLLSGKFGLI